MKLLNPQETLASVGDIELNRLWEMGKRGLILDLDNTLTPWNSDVLSSEGEQFIALARRSFRICLLSNGRNERVKKIAQTCELPYVAPAYKPWRRNYHKALGHLEMAPQDVVVVGDQVFTDILGGNWIGCYTILVAPVAKKEFSGTKLLRLLEKLVGRNA